ncbi:flagellar FlbD family protein [Cellulosilyticum sp. I15G10I2]|uniref:flagellar FlbD family protein n=1 Tax=Cellulosilyticum sp. I15G10I2 TaxID=1892843 RepID=UPI00085C57EB|nr:flagellar FlbD family protein [Cellulosilyticum sp. I15G10I2]
MIKLTKLNMQEFVINSDLIETIEHTPDTVISMTTGNKYVVKENQEDIINKIIEYKRKILLLVDR